MVADLVSFGLIDRQRRALSSDFSHQPTRNIGELIMYLVDADSCQISRRNQGAVRPSCWGSLTTGSWMVFRMEASHAGQEAHMEMMIMLSI